MHNDILDLEEAIRIFSERKDKLYFYSFCNFLRHVDNNKLLRETVFEPIFQDIKSNESLLIKVLIENHAHYFVVKKLVWDSNFFNLPTFKLELIIFNHSDLGVLTNAVKLFQNRFFKEQGQYCFTLIPSEDSIVLQALTGAGFRLIETRLTYYGNITNFESDRFLTREASHSDITNLKRVASEMVNEYDRVHADPAIDNKLADAFLAAYVEESIKGFADVVLVPNDESVPPDAFLTAKYMKDIWPKLDCNISQMVLSAVSRESCKGWYRKLIIEMTHHLKDNGADYVFFHPAATNRAVIHTYESLNFRFGQSSHILSFLSGS